MDLRGSSSPSSFPAWTIAFPAPRKPALRGNGPQDEKGPAQHGPGSRRALEVAEGSVAVLAVYVLIGAGIGFAAGAVVVGIVAGLIAGVCAVAAILLIRGSAVAAGATAERACEPDPEPVAASIGGRAYPQ